ncbi:MAG: pyridoxal-phosphate dependent enzyme [Gemmatimonadetes bacterium]|nr:pyridoxal-phosphate dependent enzyme [Gemmatimonadota bacterium]
MFKDVTANDVVAAARRLTGVADRTPLVPSPALAQIAGGEVLLKLECAQRTGSFKLRGAYNTLATLTDAQKANGIVAASAGNHGLGCAWAARELGIACVVFVPSTAPLVKQRGIRELGATVDASGADYDAAHALAIAQAQVSDATYVSPTDGDALYAGQGTVGLEILEERPDVNTIVVCVGGGGLIGGIGRYAKDTRPHVRIIGAQTDLTNAMALSVAARRVVEVPVPPTLADGLAGQIDAEGLAVGLSVMDDIVLVTEEELGAAIAWVYREHGVVVEGAGGVGIAAIRSGKLRGVVAPVAVVVSGGNIDGDVHSQLLARFPA